jgi:crotonobetainyl-CoA:carnitine CoA-transferase CaiB-like acyl-CoA transferase
LKDLFVARTTAEWTATLTRANVACAPVLTLEEVVCNPQIHQRGMILDMEDPESSISGKRKYKQIANPITFSGKRPPIRRLPPSLGQHTEEILKTLGYSPDKIAALRAAGIIDGG